MSSITAIEKYLITKIIEDFRNYTKIDNEKEFISELANAKFSDEFREQVNIEDRERIIDFIESDEDPYFRFGHMLIRPLLKRNESKDIIKEVLLDIIDKVKEPKNKIGIIFELLKYSDISPEKSKHFYDYLEKNRKIVEEYEWEWYKDEHTLLTSIEERLEKAKYKESHKKWIYLYLLSLIRTKKEDAKYLLQKYFIDNDEEFICNLNKIVNNYLQCNKLDLCDYYKDSYYLADNILNRYLEKCSRILDLGCGKAPYLKSCMSKNNKKYILVDKVEYTFENENVNFEKYDLNEVDIVNLYKKDNSNFDLIIINASLHELWIGEKIKYWNKLFGKLLKILEPGGIIYIGDYYYGEDIDDEKWAKYLQTLNDTVGHADPIDRFYKPDIIVKTIISNHNVKMVKYSEIRVSDIIKRYFYGILVEKR